MKKLLLFLVLCTIGVNAQTTLEAQAPTLQAGLDQLTFSKGTLDAQLIMEIIAEKQKELKVKAIQNVFLAKVEPAGGTIYSFTNNVVKELLLEKDQSIRTKKIMENTVNLVFTTAFLEYYLNYLVNKDRLIDFNALSTALEGPGDYTANISLKDLMIKEKKRGSGEDVKVKSSDTYEVKLIAILLDMASEAVRRDEKLKQLGLMQISYSDTYEYLNRYNNPKTYCPFKNDSIKCVEYKLQAKNLYDDMQAKLKQVTNYIGLVNYMVEHFSFRNDKLAVFSKEKLDKKTNMPDSEYLKGLGDVNSVLNAVRFDSLKKLTRELLEERINAHVTDTLTRTEITNLTKMYYYFDKASKQLIDANTDKEIIADILYTFYAEFIPLLKKQSPGSIKYIDLIGSLDIASARLASVLLYGDNPVFTVEDGKVNNFFLLAAKLYEFDKVSTISEYLKLVSDIGTLFPDNNITNALSTIVSFIKDYSVTDKNTEGKEVLTFNVESFIARLQRIKPYKHKWLEFNFTVGLNSAYYAHDILLTDNTTVNNLSFVSEKIGIKWKLKDWAFYYPRNPGETYMYGSTTYVKKTPPREPLISNLHLLAYGSGILYNVVNAKTSKEFNFPMVGLGAGITFSNALDLNISLGIPLMSDKSFSDLFYYKYINVGFDIQFLEYFDRLSEKRAANKTQKLLAKSAEKQ